MSAAALLRSASRLPRQFTAPWPVTRDAISGAGTFAAHGSESNFFVMQLGGSRCLLREPTSQISGASSFQGPDIMGTIPSVRFYSSAPSASSDEKDPLKRIFFNLMKKYRTYMSELMKSKITLDPDDPKAVSDYKTFVDGIRKKVGVLSRPQQLQTLVKREAALAPDLKTFYHALPKIKARFGITETYDGDKMMVEAVEKVEKKIGRVLKRGDKEGIVLLKKEFDTINKTLGVDPIQKKELEAEAELGFAKAELQQIKDEVVKVIEAQKKRQGYEHVQVDIKTLDHRNYL
ncbi:hypothetical protein KP509_35G045300 [Ceratopteris richardii]|uniref:ATP synthase 24 kDa subunit, mitochondrial n=1 Tax=Ceratopteris richardii TaxID=49495 RepID=A0A8T2QG75_CERRI|nr:hypothetical protein KP509_35G045300 [Ceratopteris richardii]